MKLKKLSFIGIVLVLIAAMVMVLAVGCSSTTTTTTTATTTTPLTTTTTTENVSPATLTIFAAGTLAGPFGAIDTAFEQAYPNITVQPQFAGSVLDAHNITQLHEEADILAVADYHVIPEVLYPSTTTITPTGTSTGTTTALTPAYANWYVGFDANAMTLMYAPNSKGASTINANNWYQILSEPGVNIGRSDPNTDPSGYQFLNMLQLASKYYNVPNLSQSVLANSPAKYVTSTETDNIAALQAGEIDYLAIYTSTAQEQGSGFEYLNLPSQINFSDATMAAQYATASTQTTSGTQTGSPIIYAITIPTTAVHTQAAELFVQFLLSSQGQSIMKQQGFQTVSPAIADGITNMPTSLQSMVQPWPTTTTSTP